MRRFLCLLVALGFAITAPAGETKKTIKNTWGKVKTESKKIGRGFKQVGKDIGQGTKEIFTDKK